MSQNIKQCAYFIFPIILIAALSSCDKDEFANNSEISFATVYAEEGKPLLLIPDGGGSTMYITKTAINKKELTHQRRVIATYTLLKNVTPQNLADHSYWNIRLDHITDLTCKPPVYKSKIEDPDQLGTGFLRFKYPQYTGRYLNFTYEHAGGSHDINLWYDDTNHPASNTLILSLCINSLSTATEIKAQSYVSFDVYSLVSEISEGRFALGYHVNDCHPAKLVLRYYESLGVQKELQYTIIHSAHGIGLKPD